MAVSLQFMNTGKMREIMDTSEYIDCLAKDQDDILSEAESIISNSSHLVHDGIISVYLRRFDAADKEFLLTELPKIFPTHSMLIVRTTDQSYEYHLIVMTSDIIPKLVIEVECEEGWVYPCVYITNSKDPSKRMDISRYVATSLNDTFNKSMSDKIRSILLQHGLEVDKDNGPFTLHTVKVANSKKITNDL